MGGPITDGQANVIIAQLLHLEHEDPKKDIIYINSPVDQLPRNGDLRHDVTREADVSTICVGMAASMGRCCWPAKGSVAANASYVASGDGRRGGRR